MPTAARRRALIFKTADLAEMSAGVVQFVAVVVVAAVTPAVAAMRKVWAVVVAI